MTFAIRRKCILITLSLVALIPGCPTEPQKTVTLIIDGPQELRSKIVDHVLPMIVDSGNCSISSTKIGNEPEEVDVYPVRKIGAFRRKIRFGRIDKVQGRRIYITIDKASAEISIATAMTIEYIESFLVWYEGKLVTFGFY